ncbi:hypothetical protein D3C84_1063980 [compost metagenome]
MQKHQRAELDAQRLVEVTHLQAAPGLQRLADFLHPACLPGGQVGGLQAAGVVLVFGLALFVGGRLVGGLRGADGHGQIGLQVLAHLLLQKGLVHGRGWAVNGRAG